MQRFEKIIYQRRYTGGKIAHEKMFNLNMHQGNANKLIMKYYQTLILMANIKETTPSVDKESSWNSHILVVRM